MFSFLKPTLMTIEFLGESLDMEFFILSGCKDIIQLVGQTQDTVSQSIQSAVSLVKQVLFIGTDITKNQKQDANSKFEQTAKLALHRVLSICNGTVHNALGIN